MLGISPVHGTSEGGCIIRGLPEPAAVLDLFCGRMKKGIVSKGFIESINADEGYGGVPVIYIGDSSVIFHGTVCTLRIGIICIQDIQQIFIIGKVFGNVVQVGDNIKYDGLNTEILCLSLLTVMIFQRACGLVQYENTEQNRDQKYKDEDRQKLFLNFRVMRQDVRVMNCFQWKKPLSCNYAMQQGVKIL